MHTQNAVVCFLEYYLQATTNLCSTEATTTNHLKKKVSYKYRDFDSNYDATLYKYRWYGYIKYVILPKF